VRLLKTGLLAAAAAAGFVAARRMLDRDRPPQGLPGPLQAAADHTYDRLREFEGVLTEAIREGRTAAETAETALVEEHRRRSGRKPA
jgi:hypothetical protein